MCSLCVQVILSFVIMFAIQWIYSLIELAVFFIIYFYIGRASPGYFPGSKILPPPSEFMLKSLIIKKKIILSFTFIFSISEKKDNFMEYYLRILKVWILCFSDIEVWTILIG